MAQLLFCNATIWQDGSSICRFAGEFDQDRYFEEVGGLLLQDFPSAGIRGGIET